MARKQSAAAKKASKKQDRPARPEMPPLLVEFAKWLGKHDDHAVGFFEPSDENPGEGHFQDDAEGARFAAHARLLGRTGDGSELVLVDRGCGLPYAVVYLDSEGGDATVATSPEQFLLALAKGETGVFDHDDEDATERDAFAAWVAKKKLKDPKAPAFDLGAFLEDDDHQGAKKQKKQKPAAAHAAGPPPADEKLYRDIPPRTRRMALFVGRRADDPELCAFVTDELKKKVPASLSWSKDYAWVEAGKKLGIDLLFEAHVLHDAYPEIPKSKTSLLPYLAGVHFRAKYKDPLPFGVAFDADVATLEKLLGAPSGRREEEGNRPFWHRMIDAQRGLRFTADYYDDSPQMSLAIDAARDLNDAAHSKAQVGLFIAWAITRGLLDKDRLAAHQGPIKEVAARKLLGSAFLETALPRGLWDRHLVDRPGLHTFAFGWFHNIGGRFIKTDLIKVFGRRTDKHGHDEPVLDEDTWANVDKATPALDRVFAEWISSKS